MAAREYLQEVKALDSTLVSIEKVLDLPKLKADAISLEAEASAPDLWNDPEKAQVVTSKLSRVQSTLNRITTIRRRLEDVPLLLELAEEDKDQKALAEAGQELDDVTRAIGELEVQTLLSGQYDERDALVTIRSEAGGVEAADWAEMLSRMYLRYCERNSYKVDVLETSYAKRLESSRPPSELARPTPTENYRSSKVRIDWFEYLPLTHRADAIPPLLESKWYRWLSNLITSILTRKRSGWMSIAPLVQVDRV